MSTSRQLYRHTRNLPRWQLMLQLIVVAFIFSITSACNNSNSAEENAETGEVIIGLTDAEGDLATYTVDVLSLTLTKSNGVVVETLPLNTRVDFAQYTELTEFLTAATVPNGAYTKASMVLDYSNADIQVEDASGNIVAVTSILDTDGDAIDTLTVSVALEGRNKLVIAPGITRHMTIDFDLKASNRVDFSGANPVLTVAPFLLADVELERPKPHRLRGALASVDADDQSFTLVVRPFRHSMVSDNRPGNKRFGKIRVRTIIDTVYEINGSSFVGVAGLEALAAQSKRTPVIVLGKLTHISTQPHRVFVASQVYAGSSVPGKTDVVSGHVIARSSNHVDAGILPVEPIHILQLKGVTLKRSDGSTSFNDTIKVKISDSTIVRKQLSGREDHSIAEISAGQRLTVFGNIIVNSDGSFTMDATNGKARMLLTTVKGSVVQTDSPLAIEVNSFGWHAVQLFDFSGTGVDELNDADPDFYEIMSSTLNYSGFAINEPIKAKGFVNEFGLAPEDFIAHSLISFVDAKALMAVNWRPASNTAISEVTNTGITLDLNGTGQFHHVIRLSVPTNLKAFETAPILKPGNSGKGVFVIYVQHKAANIVFKDFKKFSDALARHLHNAAKVQAVKAVGRFDDDNVTMTVREIRVALKYDVTTQ